MRVGAAPTSDGEHDRLPSKRRFDVALVPWRDAFHPDRRDTESARFMCSVDTVRVTGGRTGHRRRARSAASLRPSPRRRRRPGVRHPGHSRCIRRRATCGSGYDSRVRNRSPSPSPCSRSSSRRLPAERLLPRQRRPPPPPVPPPRPSHPRLLSPRLRLRQTWWRRRGTGPMSSGRRCSSSAATARPRPSNTGSPTVRRRPDRRRQPVPDRVDHEGIHRRHGDEPR